MKEQAAEVLSDAKESLEKWFQAIYPWTSHVVAKERYVWLLVSGIPPHARLEEMFRMLAQLVGTFIEIDESTRNKDRLDVGRILVSTSSPAIINRQYKSRCLKLYSL